MSKKCPYKPILTEKEAIKHKVGTYFHPTEKTYRTGACPDGYELKKGYTKKDTYVCPTCIKDKGIPGKIISKYKVLTLSNKDNLGRFGYSTKLNADSRYRSLLEAVKTFSYGTVIRRLVVLRQLVIRTSPKHSNIYDEDIKMLQAWRVKNPTLYKKVVKQ